jgi:phosphoglucomutase
MNTKEMNTEILERASKWINEPFDSETRKEVQRLINGDQEQLAEAFYMDLEFGTGGMRGIMGPGTNRVNNYTIGLASQGLANYVNNSFPEINPKMAIAHDCRNNSPEFARRAAEVFAANGIEVFLFDELRPTPELSFAIRHLGCQSGIVITASHNPKEYNGYKVYWDDGGQVVSPHDEGIINEVRKLDFGDIKSDFDERLIHSLGAEMDKEFLDASINQLLDMKVIESHGDVGIVYTALHGTGITLIPEALKQAGFSKISLVPIQDVPDGNFPSVESPNPEEREALNMALELATEQGADLVMGTDPDTDRVGIAVRNPQNEFQLLNGNQTGVLLVYYHLLKWQEAGKLTGNKFVARTTVTTRLIDDICKSFDVNLYTTLTGFKHIAALIREKEGTEQYVVGGEESFGYLIGDFVRDKDGVTACLLLAEIAAWAKSQGSSVLGILDSIHEKFGHYLEDLVSLKRTGKQGKEEIASMMEGFRSKPPTSLGNSDVVVFSDFLKKERTDLITSEKDPISLPVSNVLQFETADGSIVTARPSGTEPKIKFYFSVNARFEASASSDDIQTELQGKIEALKKDLGLNS